ncbi:ATP-binding protein, partial [Chloroflexota bacterium]
MKRRSSLNQTMVSRDKIELDAREASEFAENVIDTVREPLLALDGELRVVKVSRSFYEFFKVKPEETVGQLIYDLGNKQWDIPKLRELLETILPEKTAFDNYEVEHDFATIGRRIMLLNARQIERGRGKERIILLAIEDITERKEMEAGMERANKEMETFAYSVSHDLRAPLRGIDGWSLALLEDYQDKLDEQGQQYLNRVRSETQIMGKLIDDLLIFSRQSRKEMKLQQLDMTAIAQAIASGLQEQNPALQVDFVIQSGLKAHGDGSLIEVALNNLLGNALKFSSKNPHCYIEFGETEKDGNRAYFVRDNGVGFDMAYANKAVLDIWDCRNIEELRAMSLKDRYTPETVVEIEERSRHWKKGEPMLGSYEAEILTKNGETRFLEVKTNELVWDNQRRVQLIYNDVTERKRLEAEREDIQRQVQISSRLASVGEMAAGIAHEINNPLTGVVGFAELLIKRDLPEDIRKDVEMIAEGGRRVAEVVRRMLTFARQSKPYKEEVDINSIIETTLEMRTSAMKVTDINVIDELDRELPKTISDGGQLQQVFLNIILNAEKEMSSAHDKGNLRVKTERVNGIIRISISDDGPGIEEENLEKIFDPFFTTREVGQGTGLGLSVSYGIINELGGTIHAESETGKGATFIIDLPIITESEQPEPDEAGTENAPIEKPLNILLVDDEPLVNQYLNEALVNDGHEVKVITNGNEAIEEIVSKDYDVILLDIKLPGKSGMEIYNELQKK